MRRILCLVLLFFCTGCESNGSNISVIENSTIENKDGEPLGKGLKYWEDCSFNQRSRSNNYNHIAHDWCVYKMVSDDFCLKVWYKEECD